MLDVMRIDVAAVVAARERAVAVARPQRALERRRDRAALAADVERRAVLVLNDRDQAPVTREAPDGIDWQLRAPEPPREGSSSDWAGPSMVGGVIHRNPSMEG
jgi:hypothetical protein